MTHGDGLPRFSAKSAWRGDAGHREAPRHRIEAWIHAHRDRLHANVLAVAVANKLARVAWAMMASGEAFKANPRAAA